MEVMEAFADVMEAFTESTSTEASTKGSAKDFMEDIEDLKASTFITLTQASMKASTKASKEVTTTTASMKAFMEVMEVFVEVLKAFPVAICMEASTIHESFHGRYGRY